MILEDVDMTQQEEEEKRRVLDRMSQWTPDERHYDDPGYGLDDSCVMNLLHEWKTDESIRQTALHWMMEYMKKVRGELEIDIQTFDDTVSELVLQGMPFEVYEGFDQAIVPILQSRVNSTIRIEKRQSVLYGSQKEGV